MHHWAGWQDTPHSQRWSAVSLSKFLHMQCWVCHQGAPFNFIYTSGLENIATDCEYTHQYCAEDSLPYGATCTLACVCAIARSLTLKVPSDVCVWLAGVEPRANRQTAGVSVNSVVSCAPHTSGMSSPFIRHEVLWRGQDCEGTKGRSHWWRGDFLVAVIVVSLILRKHSCWFVSF